MLMVHITLDILDSINYILPFLGLLNLNRRDDLAYRVEYEVFKELDHIRYIFPALYVPSRECCTPRST